MSAVQKNPLEWSVFAAALLIVGACIALLISGVVRTGGDPADLVVSTGEAKRVTAGFRVPVRVRNTGDATAADVHVELALEKDGQEIERAELTFAFLPPRSDRQGFVLFRRDPTCCELVTGPVGFEKP